MFFQTWTKCYVKIEAIKCFPCYIKITFLKNIHETSSNAVTRINLPGLHAQMASSRTKNYAYGLFWKNNRKKCTAFFGFDAKEQCEKHLKWINMSISSLELHRQGMYVYCLLICLFIQWIRDFFNGIF